MKKYTWQVVVLFVLSLTAVSCSSNNAPTNTAVAKEVMTLQRGDFVKIGKPGSETIYCVRQIVRDQVQMLEWPEGVLDVMAKDNMIRQQSPARIIHRGSSEWYTQAEKFLSK